MSNDILKASGNVNIMEITSVQEDKGQRKKQLSAVIVSLFPFTKEKEIPYPLANIEE